MDDIEVRIARGLSGKERIVYGGLRCRSITNTKLQGYYLYFTSYYVIECMHVHASDRKLTENCSAKFFVKDNGGHPGTESWNSE